LNQQKAMMPFMTH